MKAIIKRNLPLIVRYTVIDKQYIPLSEGCGMGCDNCGKLIANIATVRNENNETFSIGFDCLETLLINNSLLSTNDIADYERVKKMIPKVLRFSKQLKELIAMNNGLDGFRFERPTGIFANGPWLTYWLLKGNAKPYNTGTKIKDMDFDFLITTLKAIFPKHLILVANEDTKS